MRRSWLVRSALFGLAVHAATAIATTTYVVNSTLDLPDADPTDGACATAPPNPVCTLRAAVMQANGHSGQDFIEIPAGTYVLTRVGYDQTANLGDLDITDDVLIYSSSQPVVIDANGAVTGDRAFEVVSGSLTLNNITIKNGNTPSYGGAIYAQARLTMSGVNILDNTAGLDGGGVYATAEATIGSGLVQGNKTHGNGGGIAIVGNATTLFSLSGMEVANNQALDTDSSGGGVYVSESTTSLNSSSLHDNSAAADGGGLAFTGLMPGVTLQTEGMLFDRNTSSGANGGGGLYCNAKYASLFAGALTNNSASGSGGGIFADGLAGTYILQNVAVSANTAGFGGGLFFEGNAKITFIGGRVDGNTATGQGGGIYAYRNNAPSKLLVSDASILTNHAGGDGGGIYANNDLTLTNSAIYANRGSRGGAAFLSGTSTAAINNSTLDGNSANGDGGGVFADAMSTVKFNSATVTTNIARTSYPSPGTGGGLYAAATSVATATASVFAYNTATAFNIVRNSCSGTLTLSDDNFIATNEGCTIAIAGGAVGNQVGGAFPNDIDPQLSTFQYLMDPNPPAYPGASPKFGRVPLLGSTLIDAGPPGGCQAADGTYLFVDEIGQFRSVNGRCDIGAVEYGAALDHLFGDGFE